MVLYTEQLDHSTRQRRQDAIKETRPTFYTQLLGNYKASSKYEEKRLRYLRVSEIGSAPQYLCPLYHPVVCLVRGNPITASTVSSSSRNSGFAQVNPSVGYKPEALFPPAR